MENIKQNNQDQREDQPAAAPPDFDEKLSSKIKSEKITPYPRWRFLLQDYVIIAAGTIALFIGAGAVAVMIYIFQDNDWDIWSEIQPNFWKFLLLTLPYFWIVFLGLFVFVLYYNLRHTRRGYRYPAWLIVAGAVLASVILGAIFYAAGLGQKIDDILGEQAPFYESIMNRHVIIWHRPEAGFLTGQVIDSNPDGSFDIMDMAGQSWRIIINADDFVTGSGFSSSSLQAGQPVNMIGQVMGDHQFQVRLIRPVNSGRGFISRPRARSLPPRLSPPVACQDNFCGLPAPSSTRLEK